MHILRSSIRICRSTITRLMLFQRTSFYYFSYSPWRSQISYAYSFSGMTPKLERSNSITGSSRMGIPLVPSLQPSQVFTLRKSWKHINTKGLNSVIRRCFERVRHNFVAPLWFVRVCQARMSLCFSSKVHRPLLAQRSQRPKTLHRMCQEPVCLERLANTRNTCLTC